MTTKVFIEVEETDDAVGTVSKRRVELCGCQITAAGHLEFDKDCAPIIKRVNDDTPRRMIIAADDTPGTQAP